MAIPRIVLPLLATLSLLCTPGWTSDPDPCNSQVVSAPSGGLKRLGVTFKSENCSSLPLGKHWIHEVLNVSYSHMTCEDRLAVVVNWNPSPLGIEHVRGFRVYVEEKDPEGKQCQHLILKDPRQLTFNYRNTKLSSLAFHGLNFETDYLVRVVPFPTRMMNDTFFPPSFLRTNSCELLLGPENLACKPYWKPRTLNVSQNGSNLHVAFDHAPSTFGFAAYFLYFKLRQEGPFRTQRCTPDYSLPRTLCTLQDVAPGTYAIELRDENNLTRRKTQFYVGQGHSPWAGPIRAMAITVPLVVLSAFATLFTVMCRKKQQENIYSQLDEDSSESSNHGAAQSVERMGPRPKVLVVYSNRDGDQHNSVIQAFAYFLQDFCRCEVVLDLWEHLQICKEGQMSWLSRQLDQADHVLVICSRGLRYHVERKSCRGKTPVGRRGISNSAPVGGTGSDLFIVGVAMIAEKLRLANQGEGGGGEGLGRYVAAYFDYSSENDVPTLLSLAPRLKLMDQLSQLVVCLHPGGAWGSSDRTAAPINASRRNYFRSRSGRALYVAICNMHQHISLHHQDAPPPACAPPPAACSPTGSFPVPPAPQPHSSYFSGMTGPQHPFYNRPYFPNHVYHLPRHYPHHVPSSSFSRPSFKAHGPPKEHAGGLVSRSVLLSNLNTDAVCERLQLMEGIEPNMVPLYSATIKKANVNGRVLSQCNLDELKKEMEMNFGDWQLFRGMVMELRHTESQAVLQDESRAASEQSSSVLQVDLPAPRPPNGGLAQRDMGGYSLSLSFEELSAVGLEEPPRLCNPHWPVANHRTASMSSLNSQESSNDICKLTDKQQAEYHDAYREYIAQMTDVSGGAGEKPVLPPLPGQFLQAAAGGDDKAAKDGGDPDGRKPFSKRGSKPGDGPEFLPAADAPLLDPISEEDEKLDHSVSSRASRKRGPGPQYHELPSDDDDSGSEDADNSTPLLPKQARGAPAPPAFLSEALLAEKDSSDSGVRPGDSSSDRSLEEEDEDGGTPGPLESEGPGGLVMRRGVLPSSLQDAAVARMSICSEAASEASLMASSPDEGWPAANLNASTDGALDNAPAANTNANNSQQRQDLRPDSHTPTSSSSSSSTLGSPSDVAITPGSGSTTTATVHHNQNLRSISLGDERESVL